MHNHLLENGQINDLLHGFFLLAELVSFIAICLFLVIFVPTYLPHFALCLLLVASHFTSAKIITQIASLRTVRLLITASLKVKYPPRELLPIHSANIWGPTRSTYALQIWSLIISEFYYPLLVHKLLHDSQVHISYMFCSCLKILDPYE